MPVAFFELVVACIALYLSLTQIVGPVVRGTKLFPMFRRERRLRADISGRHQNLSEAALEQELKQLDQELEKNNEQTNGQ